MSTRDWLLTKLITAESELARVRRDLEAMAECAQTWEASADERLTLLHTARNQVVALNEQVQNQARSPGPLPLIRVVEYRNKNLGYDIMWQRNEENELVLGVSRQDPI